jgi:hypothetical protein|eukprot:15363812-Ditylum_brightwellii.AAC.2
MNGASSVVVQELERACNCVVGPKNWEASIHPYGSCALGVSLPSISDLDVVVQLRPVEGDHSNAAAIASSEFFRAVTTRISQLQ